MPSRCQSELPLRPESTRNGSPKPVDHGGTDLFFHWCMSAFFHQVPNNQWTPDDLVRAAGFMGRRFGAVGEFLGGGATHDRMAAAVKAEWAEPLYFQYKNIGWGGNRISTGFHTLRDR